VAVDPVVHSANTEPVRSSNMREERTSRDFIGETLLGKGNMTLENPFAGYVLAN
jgi:hypothetical protein